MCFLNSIHFLQISRAFSIWFWSIWNPLAATFFPHYLSIFRDVNDVWKKFNKKCIQDRTVRQTGNIFFSCVVKNGRKEDKVVTWKKYRDAKNILKNSSVKPIKCISWLVKCFEPFKKLITSLILCLIVKN